MHRSRRLCPPIAAWLALFAACGDATAPAGDGVAVVQIAPRGGTLRQGDVAVFTGRALDAAGTALSDITITWSVAPAGAGFVTSTGRFVGYEPGTVRLIAEGGSVADTALLTVTPRGLAGTFSVVGQGLLTGRFTSDLWVSGSAAYTGTWGDRGTMTSRPGNTLYTWDVADPTQPRLADSLAVDAETVNDVKIRAAGDLAVITHEGSADGQNGITLLDLANPLAPAVITRFTRTLEPGVHNVWIEGDLVYAAVDGAAPSSGLRIVDVSDPRNPVVVAGFYGGASFLHDVYVRDGLAFLSHWNAGLIILDVGAGIAGGTPANLVEVGRTTTVGGNTHNAWYWPQARYVLVGEENFQRPGVMHVVDVIDLANPVEVASFAVPGTTPHNFWLDEARGILYLAWYGNGIRALDVTGELLGQLERQGREIVGLRYAAGGACPAVFGTDTCSWAPQLHDGLVYVSDMNTGLWVLRPEF